MTRFLNFYFAIITIVLLATLASCSVISESITPVQGNSDSEGYDSILVPSYSRPLYANLDEFNTKSSDIDDFSLVSLESLIDRTKSQTRTFQQYRLTEIPFISNVSPAFAVLSDNANVSNHSFSEIIHFLIETTDMVRGTTDRKVVTMIPDENYRIRNADEAYSYIHKGVFSGVILYSDLDGRFRDVYYFGGDFCPIIDAEVIDSSDADSYSNAYFLFLVTDTLTKCDETGPCLEPSICIAFRETDNPEGGTPSNGEDDLGSGGNIGGGGGAESGNNGDGSDAAIPGGGASPGGGSNPNGDSSSNGSGNNENGLIINNPDGSSEDVPEEIPKYVVSLYNSEGGMAKYSGIYQEGSFITCIAIPANGYIFDRWVGDFYGKEESFNYIVRSDISATAYFRKLLDSGPVRPCLDTLTGKMNPLIEMTLAPSNTWSNNYKGATFGRTRAGGKFHSGIDLYAEPGTPIYSMFDGIVSNSNYVTEQPMRDKDGNYPVGYNGDKNGAGNRLYIGSNIDGEDIMVGYWHLLVDNPIAINPRTGMPFKSGDKVYQGEIIAYSGRTGNASNPNEVPYAHLHLVVKKDNIYVNPELYINGKLNSHGVDMQKIVSTTEINNIICH